MTEGVFINMMSPGSTICLLFRMACYFSCSVTRSLPRAMSIILAGNTLVSIKFNKGLTEKVNNDKHSLIDLFHLWLKRKFNIYNLK